VEEGETVAIIGPNGAGKSTTFGLISGFLKPSAGEIEFIGEKIDCFSPAEICLRGLVRTFQQPHPFPGATVLDNVMIGAFLRTKNKREAENKAREILKVFGMESKAEMMGDSLTLAELRMLEACRALATGPRFMLLDEMLAGLTPVETVQMTDFIQSLKNSGMTLMITEHVMQVIMALSDRVIAMISEK